MFYSKPVCFVEEWLTLSSILRAFQGITRNFYYSNVLLKWTYLELENMFTFLLEVSFLKFVFLTVLFFVFVDKHFPPFLLVVDMITKIVVVVKQDQCRSFLVLYSQLIFQLELMLVDLSSITSSFFQFPESWHNDLPLNHFYSLERLALTCANHINYVVILIINYVWND